MNQNPAQAGPGSGSGSALLQPASRPQQQRHAGYNPGGPQVSCASAELLQPVPKRQAPLRNSGLRAQEEMRVVQEDKRPAELSYLQAATANSHWFPSGRPGQAPSGSRGTHSTRALDKHVQPALQSTVHVGECVVFYPQRGQTRFFDLKRQTARDMPAVTPCALEDHCGLGLLYPATCMRFWCDFTTCCAGCWDKPLLDSQAVQLQAPSEDSTFKADIEKAVQVTSLCT